MGGRRRSSRVRKVTQLTLTFDHRVCDGGTAGGFLRYVADAIENPGSALADLWSGAIGIEERRSFPTPFERG